MSGSGLLLPNTRTTQHKTLCLNSSLAAISIALNSKVRGIALKMDIRNKQFGEDAQDALKQILLARRDVRGNNFLQRDIAAKHLDDILEAAQCAPSVGLSQPWQIVLIKEADTKATIYQNCQKQTNLAAASFTSDKQTQYHKLKLDGIIEAPLNMAVYYTPPQVPIIGNNTMPEVGEYSVVCAIQNMWLMARALNIGMGWVSIIEPDEVNRVLNAPKHYKLIAYLCFGYSKTFYDIPELEERQWQARRLREDGIQFEGFSS